jgi:hypothetical protein
MNIYVRHNYQDFDNNEFYQTTSIATDAYLQRTLYLIYNILRVRRTLSRECSGRKFLSVQQVYRYSDSGPQRMVKI